MWSSISVRGHKTWWTKKNNKKVINNTRWLICIYRDIEFFHYYFLYVFTFVVIIYNNNHRVTRLMFPLKNTFIKTIISFNELC